MARTEQPRESDNEAHRAGEPGAEMHAAETPKQRLERLKAENPDTPAYQLDYTYKFGVEGLEDLLQTFLDYNVSDPDVEQKFREAYALGREAAAAGAGGEAAEAAPVEREESDLHSEFEESFAEEPPPEPEEREPTAATEGSPTGAAGAPAVEGGAQEESREETDAEFVNRKRYEILNIDLAAVRRAYAEAEMRLAAVQDPHERLQIDAEATTTQARYREAVRGVREHLLRDLEADAALSAQEKSARIREIILETSAVEANRLYDLKTQIKIEERERAQGERLDSRARWPAGFVLAEAARGYGRLALRAAERYRTLPVKQKLIISGVLAGGSMAALAAGLPAIATALGIGVSVQRVFGAGAAAIAVEALHRRRQERKAEKEVMKEVERIGGQLTALLQADNQERLNAVLLRLAGRKGWEESRRKIAAGVVFAGVASGAASLLGRAGIAYASHTEAGHSVAKFLHIPEKWMPGVHPQAGAHAGQETAAGPGGRGAAPAQEIKTGSRGTAAEGGVYTLEEAKKLSAEDPTKRFVLNRERGGFVPDTESGSRMRASGGGEAGQRTPVAPESRAGARVPLVQERATLGQELKRLHELTDQLEEQARLEQNPNIRNQILDAVKNQREYQSRLQQQLVQIDESLKNLQPGRSGAAVLQERQRRGGAGTAPAPGAGVEQSPKIEKPRFVSQVEQDGMAGVAEYDPKTGLYNPLKETPKSGLSAQDIAELEEARKRTADWNKTKPAAPPRAATDDLGSLGKGRNPYAPAAHEAEARGAAAQTQPPGIRGAAGEAARGRAAELATVRRGEGAWQAVRRQFYERIRLHPDKFGLTPEQAGKLPADPDKLGQGTKAAKILNRETLATLRKAGYINPDGTTNVRISRPGVRVILNPDNSVRMEGAGKLSYEPVSRPAARAGGVVEDAAGRPRGGAHEPTRRAGGAPEHGPPKRASFDLNQEPIRRIVPRLGGDEATESAAEAAERVRGAGTKTLNANLKESHLVPREFKSIADMKIGAFMDEMDRHATEINEYLAHGGGGRDIFINKGAFTTRGVRVDMEDASKYEDLARRLKRFVGPLGRAAKRSILEMPLGDTLREIQLGK